MCVRLMITMAMLLTMGCLGSDPVPTKDQVGCTQPNRCTSTSECCGKALCQENACRAPCAEDTECGFGGTCGDMDKRCRNCTDKPCTRESDCCGKSTCAGDSTCRVVCTKDAECAAGFSCFLDKPTDAVSTCHKR